MKDRPIGYEEAKSLTLENIHPLKSEMLPITECTDRVISKDMYSLVNSPSVDASLKDGYAIISEDIEAATDTHPITLRVKDGTLAAGHQLKNKIKNGDALRILTGGMIPSGSNAVVAEEFTTKRAEKIIVTRDADPGRNILLKGSDIFEKERICEKGTRLSPGIIGLLAAGGYSELPVYKNPRVFILATGDEVVLPGEPLPEGKLYASNMATLNSWCRRYGMKTGMDIVKDIKNDIREKLVNAISRNDAVLTSGGAWTGDRDYVVHILETLGWRQFFHRIRIGPGKGVGFGILENKPVFILPGGPPSNLLAFLKIALPGLMKLGGMHVKSFPLVYAKLRETVHVRDENWTQFIFGEFTGTEGFCDFRPLRLKSRLQSMARAQGIVTVPEGTVCIKEGAVVPVQVLS